MRDRKAFCAIQAGVEISTLSCIQSLIDTKNESQLEESVALVERRKKRYEELHTTNSHTEEQICVQNRHGLLHSNSMKRLRRRTSRYSSATRQSERKSGEAKGGVRGREGLKRQLSRLQTEFDRRREEVEKECEEQLKSTTTPLLKEIALLRRSLA